MAKGHPKLHSKKTAKHPGFDAVKNKIAKNIKPRPGQTKEEAAAGVAGANYRKQLAKKKRG